MDCIYEERLVQDANGFWCVEARFFPYNKWEEPYKGWGTIFKSSIKEHALERMSVEFRKEYE